MAAPTLKSGTGHAALESFTDTSTLSAPNLGTNASAGTEPSGIEAHATGSGNACYFISGDSSTYHGRKATFSSQQNIATEGTFFLIHTKLSTPIQKSKVDFVRIALKNNNSTDYRVWVVDGKATTNPLMDFCGICIDPRNSVSQQSEAGSFNPAAITQVEVLFIPVSGESGRVLNVSRSYKVSPYVIINGDSGNPGKFATAIDQSGISNTPASAYLRTFTKAGSSIYTISFSIHVGDGTTTTYFSDSGKTIIFPTPTGSSGTDKRFHIPDGHFGVKFTGGTVSPSTFSITNCTLLGSHYLDLLPGAGDTCTITGCSFSNVTRFTFNSQATFSGCTIADSVMVPIKDGTFTGSNSILRTTSAYAADLGASTALSGISFTAAGSEYAIRLTPTGTGSFTLTGCTFNGYATGKKIYINDSNPAHTITISGSGITSADITSAGAAFVVPATSTSIAHSTLQNGTRYRIYNVTTATELANDVVSGTGFSLPFTSGISNGDTIRLTTAYQSGTTVKWGGPWNAVAVVGGTVDFSANSPTTVSEFAAWGIDGSTVSELATDYVNVEAELTPTAAIDYDRNKFLAFIAYAMTTANGIRNWHGALTVQDSANVVINIAMTWLSTNLTYPVRLTGSTYIVRSDENHLIGQGLSMQTGKTYLVTTGSGPLTSQQQTYLQDAANNSATIASRLTSTRAGYIDQIPSVASSVTTVDGKVDTVTSAVSAVGSNVVLIDGKVEDLLTAVADQPTAADVATAVVNQSVAGAAAGSIGDEVKKARVNAGNAFAVAAS